MAFCEFRRYTGVVMASKVAARKGNARLIDVDAASFETLPCCGIKNPTHPGRQQKGCWLRENAQFGLRAKVLLLPDGQPGGYIEYVPGEFAWRGVDAAGYMFIHCIWIYSRNQHKGWGGFLVRACLEDAQEAGMSGAAVMVREGPLMAGRRLFLKHGFKVVDTAPPDCELLAKRFDGSAPLPAFKKDWGQKLRQYSRGLTIIRSSQCPYFAKYAADIAEAAKNEYHIKPTVIELKSWRDAQRAPTPYAVFSVIHNGQVLADRQISGARFRNIMYKLRMECR